MRESLTFVAALLILCLSIALAAPYFVDWNAQRGLFEEQLSHALGERVRIGGGIDLKLLPTPYLHLQNIEIMDDAAAARLTAEDLFLEIAIPPLLRGEIDFIVAHAQRPHLKLTEAADGTLQAPQPKSFSGQARFERIDIEDGKIEIDDPVQSRNLIFDHIDLNAEATSLAGPFKGDGSSLIADEKTTFRFSTGQRDGDNLRLKLIVDADKTHPRADIDGTLALEPLKTARLAASFTGTAGFTGIWHGGTPKNSFTLPWHVSGPLRIAAHKATMETLELRLGDEDRAITATGSADFDFSATPKANVALHARQIDIDRMLADPAHAQTPETFEQNLKNLVEDAGPPAITFPLMLDAKAETATFNGETLTGLSAALVFNQTQPVWLRFEGGLPGRSQLHVDGHLESGSAVKFDGKIEASIRETDRLTAWLAGTLPHEAEQLRKLPFRALDVNGEMSLSRVGFSGRNMNLRFDRSVFSGDLSYTQAVGPQAARLFADLSSPSLELDGLPDLKDARQFTQATDLSIRFNAPSVKVTGLRKGSVDTGEIRFKLIKTGNDFTLEDMSLNGLGGANIKAKGLWNGSAGNLDAKLHVPQLADLTEVLKHVFPAAILNAVSPRASILSPLQLDLHAEATQSEGASPPTLTALNASGTAGTSRITAAIRSDPKAPTLSSMSATIDAPDAGLLLRQLGTQVLPLNELGRGHIELKTQGPLGDSPDTMLQATLAGFNVTFHGRFDASFDANTADLNANGQLKLTSTDLSPFLQATGLAFPDQTTRFPADLTSDLDWRPARLDLRSLKGSFAGATFSGFLTYGSQDGVKKLTGTLDTDKTSATALAQLALGPPQPAKTGFLWSGLSFNSGLPDAPAASLTLRAKNIDILPGLSGENAALQLEMTPGVFTFRDFTMKTGGGTAAGTLTLRRDGPTAAVTGHIVLENYGVDLPSLRTRASAALDLSGSGQNALALMSSLAGSGHASFANLTVQRADPGALTRVFADVEHDKLNVDQAEVERALNRELDKGALKAGSWPFDLGLAAGILRLTPASAQDPPASPVAIDELSLSLDLRTAAVTQRIGLALNVLPRDWQGSPPRLAMTFKGAPASPARTIETASFVNTLAARAITREAARIQAYEFDIHERAVFNQRLQRDRRHEQEELKAEEEVRLAAEAARKAEEAARIERLHKIEELRREEIRKSIEEQTRANATPDVQPQARPKPSNALETQHPGLPADPSTAGRY